MSVAWEGVAGIRRPAVAALVVLAALFAGLTGHCPAPLVTHPVGASHAAGHAHADDTRGEPTCRAEAAAAATAGPAVRGVASDGDDPTPPARAPMTGGLPAWPPAPDTRTAPVVLAHGSALLILLEVART